MTMPSTDGAKVYNMGHGAATITHKMRNAQTTAAFLLPHLKPTDKILDLGCGPGTITVGFADYVTEGSVLGVDYSANAIALAEKTLANVSSQGEGSLQSAKRGPVRFEVGNVLEGLKYADDAFDVVYLSQVLVHLPPGNGNLNTALQEIRRVLKPNGILASSDLASQIFYPFTNEIHKLWYANLSRAASASPESNGLTMRKSLREAGFDPSKTQIGGSSVVYADRERCQALCDSFAGRLAQGQGFRKAFLEAGQSEEEIDECISYFKRWNASEDVYYGQLNTEVLAWK